MSSTKLLLITSEFPPQPGGIGNHAHHLATSLKAHQYNTMVLVDQRSQTGEEEAAFDARQNYKIVRIKRHQLVLFTYIQRFRKALRHIKQHDVVVVSGKFSIWIAGIARFFTSKPIIAVIHGSEVAIAPSLKQRFMKWSLRRCSQVIAVSNYTKSLVANWNLQPVTVIPNGFSIATKVSKNSCKTDVIRLITVGNVTQRKGQHNVIKALPTLLKEFPTLQYDIVGIPTEKDMVMQLAAKLNVTSSVVWHGKVSEAKKEVLLQNATVFIMLSERTKTGAVEGFGIAILEANSLGLPAIGAKGCGIEDAISNQKSGVLVAPNEPQQIVEALKCIVVHYDDYSNNAVRWSQTFTWEKISSQYATVLRQ